MYFLGEFILAFKDMSLQNPIFLTFLNRLNSFNTIICYLIQKQCFRVEKIPYSTGFGRLTAGKNQCYVPHEINLLHQNCRKKSIH